MDSFSNEIEIEYGQGTMGITVVNLGSETASYTAIPSGIIELHETAASFRYMSISDLLVLTTGILADGESFRIDTVDLSFGLKSQVAPVLMIRGSYVKENGVLNTTCVEALDVQDSAVLGSEKGGSNTIWQQSTDGTYTTRLDKTNVPHAGISSTYRCELRATLNAPKASNSPKTYHEQMYLQFETYCDGPINDLKVFYFDGAIDGTFDTGLTQFDKGESVDIETVAGPVKWGKMVSVSVGGKYINLITSAVLADLEGATVRGATTGAFVVTNGTGLINSVKLLRGWETSGGGSQRMEHALGPALSFMNVFGRDSSGTEIPGTRQITYGLESPWEYGNEENWHTIENQFDYSGETGNIRYAMNGVVSGQLGDIDLAGKSPTSGPQLASFGFDANTYPQCTLAGNWGDVYCDFTMQKIVLGNAPYWSDCTIRPVCEPIAWSDKSVIGLLYQGKLGALNGGSIWVYVFNADTSNNPINMFGLPLV